MNNNIIIHKNNKTVEALLKETSMHPLLPIEEETSLLERIQTNDKEAMQKFCESNTHLVASVTKLYLDKGEALDKLVKAGKKGQEQACEKFDPNRGFKFAAYAV